MDCTVGDIPIGPEHPLVIIAGPCVLEDTHTNETIASALVDLCGALELPLIFKASFDKANRSSITSPRGPGLDAGLEMLAAIKTRFDVPITTDIHEREQAARAGEVVDMLQVPAFLCRQTDLLLACARTGKPVNAKKGQFMAPAEMSNVIAKLREGGATDVMVTERGTFFGYHRLVNDFIGLGELMDLDVPVCFDVTHSTQLPGATGTATAGVPERAPLLARAATAAGVDVLFVECHPDPTRAASDGSTAQPLSAMEDLLASVAAIRRAMSPAPR
jgi:2-dehydro-3-deoxyphosphooctonate aldolase (KDO 8-P synthase)